MTTLRARWSSSSSGGLGEQPGRHAGAAWFPSAGAPREDDGLSFYSGRGWNRPGSEVEWRSMARETDEPYGEVPGTLRRLAMIDEGFVGGEAGLGLALARTSILEPEVAALVQLGILVASGSPAVCRVSSTARALAARATEDEIADVLRRSPRSPGSPGRCAAPDVATALGYDIGAALEDSTIRDSRPPGDTRSATHVAALAAESRHDAETSARSRDCPSAGRHSRRHG